MKYMSVLAAILITISTCDGMAQKIGNALHLDDHGEYVNLGGESNLSFGGNQEYTIECWVKPDDDNRIRVIVSKFNLGIRGEYQLSLNGSNTVSIDRESSSVLSGNVGIYIGGYNHIAATYDGTKSRIYVNGVLDVSDAKGSQPSDTITPVLIGARLQNSIPSDFYVGSIDDVRIWNYAKTAQEIQDQRNVALTGSEPGLVGYWPLDEFEDLGVGDPGVNDLRDLSPNGNHGDAKGSPQIVQQNSGADEWIFLDDE